jgi:hypothetical protein
MVEEAVSIASHETRTRVVGPFLQFTDVSCFARACVEGISNITFNASVGDTLGRRQSPVSKIIRKSINCPALIFDVERLVSKYHVLGSVCETHCGRLDVVKKNASLIRRIFWIVSPLEPDAFLVLVALPRTVVGVYIGVDLESSRNDTG